MRILVLGGYGFIGAEICRALVKEGFDVVGLGRDVRTGRRLLPEMDWIGADLSRLDSAAKWAPHLAGVDAIVNAAGALQDSARDDLDAVHRLAIIALMPAAEAAGVRRFVQISAPGAAAGASTAFMRTKALGDAAVRASTLDWVVFKPGLVIGRNAYGASALVRMLAALPVATPLVAAGARVQTVFIDDVSAAVVAALRGEVSMRRDYDLVEDRSHSLREIVRGFRRYIGFAPARFGLDLPSWVGAIVSSGADLAGALGWRSPLRTTAMKALAEDVVGDPRPWRDAGGRSLTPFGETLTRLSSTAQERLYARAQLAVPLMVIALGAYWIASGAVGLANLDSARSHLLGVTNGTTATALVAAGSLVDILVGAGLLIRRTARHAALASVAVALVYLVAGTLIDPMLWLDPLGVFVKVVPIMSLGLAVALLLPER